MAFRNHSSSPGLPRRSALVGLGGALALALAVTAPAGSAMAAPGDAGFLGDAEVFSVLAHTTATNSGVATLLDRQLGVDAGTATGFIPTQYPAGSDFGGALSISAQTDATAAVNDLVAVPNFVYGATDLASHTFLAGAYSSATNINFTGQITLQGDADDVFIFTAVDQIIIGGSTSVVFSGGAQPCNVFWRSGSNTSIGTNSAFVGTVIAGTEIAVNTDATIDGRLIAQTDQVSLLNNRFVSSLCLPGGDGNRGLAVAPIAPTVTAAPVVPVVTPAVLPAAELAATALDQRRPMAVALFIVLLGVAMLSGATLVRRRTRH